MSVGEPGFVVDQAPMAEDAAADRPARRGELIAALSAALLLVVMFALKWYGVVGLARMADRSGTSSAVNAWTQLTSLRWLMLLSIFVALGAVVLHASQRGHGAQTDTGPLVTGLGVLTALLLANRVLIGLPAPTSVVDVKLGGYLGLLCAIGVALGGYQAMRDERAWDARSDSERRVQQGLPSPEVPR